MKILVASANEKTRARLKEGLEQLGHPTLIVSSLPPLQNLVQAGYQIDMIFCERRLADCRGTDIIAEVGMATPSILFGVKGKIFQRFLKNRCFPNTSFLPDSLESPQAWTAITSLIENHQRNVAQKQVNA